MPLQVEQQVLQQFATNWSSQPLPSSARQQADQSNQLPQETIGLYVAPHPRISSCSLYKMEQRLSGARKLDAQRLVKQVQEQFPDAQQIGMYHSLCLHYIHTAAVCCLEPACGACERDVSRCSLRALGPFCTLQVVCCVHPVAKHSTANITPVLSARSWYSSSNWSWRCVAG